MLPGAEMLCFTVFNIVLREHICETTKVGLFKSCNCCPLIIMDEGRLVISVHMMSVSGINKSQLVD